MDVELRVLDTDAGVEKTFARGEVPILQHGDHLRLLLRNNSDEALDVTILYVDGRWGISMVYPRPGYHNRIGPGGALQVPGWIDTREQAGLERAIVIAVPARGNPANFGFLAQSELPVSRGDRSGGDAVYALLEQAGFVGGEVGNLRGRSVTDQDVILAVRTWESR